MISVWKTGTFDYTDSGIKKPVKYDVSDLIEVASRTSKINVTTEHEKDVISEMSNFIVKDGMLMADEPNNLELKGMGFSPVFKFDLLDMGDYYKPQNIEMTEIGYTKTPRSHIVYNSITVANEDNNMDDKQLRQTLDENKKLNEEIGVLKSQIKQLKKSNTDKEKEIKEIKDSYSDVDSKIKEYDSLKDIESKYNTLISSKKDDLIHQIVGDDKEKAEKLQSWSMEQLELQKELMSSESTPRGVSPNDAPVDDGNDPVPTDDGNDSLEKDEMVEFYKSEFGENPSFINE